MGRAGGRHRAPRHSRTPKFHSSTLWRRDGRLHPRKWIGQPEARLLLGGFAIAATLVLVGSLLPSSPVAAATGPLIPDSAASALIREVSQQTGRQLSVAERDRAAASAWLAAMQEMATLTAADRVGHSAAANVASAPILARSALPQQAALDEAAGRTLLAALPANWSALQRASLLKNNDRIGNRDDEWSRADRRVYLGTPRATAVDLLAKFGFGLEQWTCLDRMWWQESNWNPTDSTGATYGIPQALPGTKMAAAGADWKTNPTTQIRWGLAYITSSYGTPCDAWAFWSQHYWY
ncbi:MAG: hypothetical protein WCJ42_07965 [Actinomycetes bacterium]